jgi:hypothetical protein
MAASKSSKRKKPYQRVLKFPQVKGKKIERAELSVSSDYFTVGIYFQDKTMLSFDLEPCVRVFSEVINWGTGNYKLLRRWRPVHSESSRV